MQKIVISLLFILMATLHVQAQDMPATTTNTPTLMQEAGNYYYYGNQVMNKKEYRDFLSTHCQPAYQQYQSGFKCYQAGWGLVGASLGIDLLGSILLVGNPRGGSDAMFTAGMICIGLGACGLLASIPTIFIGYSRMGKSVDTFNISQTKATAPQAYWSIETSPNSIGIALNF